jgi:hypothetical protein
MIKYIFNSLQKLPIYFISTKYFLAKEQKKTKAAWERNHYTGMTEEERKQNYNHHKMKKDTLCPKSIVMENPAWVSEIESPIIQAQCATTLEAAWNDPDFFNSTWRPLYIPSKFEHSPDQVNDDAKQALCAQQNQGFQNMF